MRPFLAMASWALACGLLMGTPMAWAQQGPIRLFPEELAPAQPVPDGAAEPPVTTPEATASQPPGPAPPGDAQAEAAGRLRVEGLAAPALDAIGLAGPAEGGLGRDLWQSSDPDLVPTLLAALPVQVVNPPLRRLTRRVLLTGAPLPGVADPSQVLAIRVERLLAMGDLDAAGMLLDRLPPSGGDSTLVRLAAETALLLGDDQKACARAAEVGPTTAADFWAKIAILCRLAAGDQAGARLSLDLLRDSGAVDDPAFLQLASTLVEGEDPSVPSALVEPTALHLALLRSAGLALPPAMVATLTPATASAVARDEVLAGDLRLEVAEHAFATGGLDRATLTRLYAAAAAVGEDGLPGRIESAWGPDTRARVYAALQAEGGDPATRAMLLAASWQAAQGSERFLVAELYDQQWTDLPIERDLIRLAPGTARALLLTDRAVPAAGWYKLLESEAGGSSGARDAAVELAPLFALAGFGGSTTVPRMDRETIAAWQGQLSDPELASERMFALLDGVGSPVPTAAWHALVVPPLARSDLVPEPALWRGLARALAEERRGEALLFALALLDGRPETVHAEALVAALRGLGTIGLDPQARAIAVATAIGLGL